MKNSIAIIVIATIFIIQNSIAQNVGIGISTPLSKLHIFNGTSGATPFLSALAVENNGHTYINLLSPAANETGLLFGIPGIPYDGAIIYNNVNAFNGFQFRTNGNLTRMVINNNGNVGIGLNAPSAHLSISATGTELAGSSASNSLRTLAGTLGNSIGNELNLASIGFSSSNNSSLGIKAYRNTCGSDWTSTSLLLTHDVDNSSKINGSYIALAANGNIGIGTPVPTEKLVVTGNVKANDFLFTSPKTFLFNGRRSSFNCDRKSNNR